MLSHNNCLIDNNSDNEDNLNNLLLVYQEVGNIERINRVHELLVAIK
jgi:hypothetical protein